MLALRESILQLYPEPYQELARASLDELQWVAAQLGIEVIRAEHAGISYAEASERPADFPTMARVHHGVVDFLQYEPSNDEAVSLRAVLDHCRDVEPGDFHRACFAIAADGQDAPRSALLRFLVYQCLRLSMWIGTWDSGGAVLEAAGVLRELDVEAEHRLRARLDQAAMHEPEIRPLNVLWAELWEYLDAAWRQRREFLLDHGRRAVDGLFAQIIRACEIAREADAGDAALLRNQIAAALGRESVQLIPLADMHPMALPSGDAAKQRQKRLKDKLDAAGAAPATRPRIIDLILDHATRQESAR